MKKLILFFAILISSLSWQEQAHAQVGISVNIGRQPTWGPVGYDYVENYYIPDLDLYYNVPRGEYVYFDNGRWISSRSLPPAYSNYDLHDLYKVVINKPSPWLQHSYYANRYSGYRGRRGQVVIRNSNDPRYYRSRNYGGYRRDYNRRWRDHDHDRDFDHDRDRHRDFDRDFDHDHDRGHHKD